MMFQLPNSDEASLLKSTDALSSSMLEAWTSLPAEVRAALVTNEMGVGNTVPGSSFTTGSTSSSSSSDGERANILVPETVEVCPQTGTRVVLKPLERAPKNVFEFSKTHTSESMHVEKTSAAVVTTKTSVMTRTRGWRNVFSLPIAYDVNMIPRGTILDTTNPSLLDATGNHPEGYNRRFAVLDDAIDRLYGDKIRNYFAVKGIELTTCILNGGEDDKRPAVSAFLCINDTPFGGQCFFRLRKGAQD